MIFVTKSVMNLDINYFKTSKDDHFIMNILSFINKISYNKALRPFLEKSYSLELLFFLYEQNDFSGIENLYYEIKSPKCKLPSFRKYIYYLHDKKCLKIKDNPKILREKIVNLSPSMFLQLDAITKFNQQQT